MRSLRTNLFLLALGLSLLGLVIVYSSTYHEYGTHYLLVRVSHMVLAVAAFFVASRIRYTAWKKLAPWAYAGVAVSLALVLVPGIGTEVGGARRWLDLGVMSVQPAEFAKVAAVLMLSCAIAHYRPRSGIPWGPLAAIGLLVGLVILEPDFDTSVVILAGVAGTLWASEVRTGALLLMGGTAAGLLFGVMLMEPYRRERFMTFLDPWAAPDGSGYQVVQSMIAIQSGSVFGAGVGSGNSDAIVPEANTDMIFAMIGEELGLVGTMLVIFAFIALALLGYRIAMSTPSVLGRCLAAGLTTMLIFQAMLNIGATMGLLPLAGMTLPFVSYGGSSLIVSFAAVGILYRISEDSERAREVKPGENAGTGSKPGTGPEAFEGRYRGRRNRGTRDSRAVRGG